MAKRISYYELLQSERDEDIMNIPVTALDLPSKASFLVRKYGTVGNLVRFGKANLMNTLSPRFSNYKDMTDCVFEIEESLAKLGLKLEGSDFTAGDVRVEKLGLVRDAGRALFKIKHKVKTLDDLVIFGSLKLSRIIPENKTVTILEISQALEKYGLKLEGSEYRINEERFFPLNDYLKYLPEKRKKEVLKIKQVDIRRAYFATPKVNLQSLSQSELLETSIEELPVSQSIKQAFDKNKIKTIGELVNTPERNIKRYISHDQFCTIEDVLASFNLKLIDSQRIIKDRKVIRSRVSRLLPTAPKKQDITKLDKSEQDKFLDTPISEFLSPRIVEFFKPYEQFKTIRDFTLVDRNSLSKLINNDSMIQTLKKILDDYGLSFSQGKKVAKVSKYINEIKIKSNNIPENLSEEQKKAYLSLPLLEAGFTKTFLEVISKTGIQAQTISDVIKHPRSEYFRKGLSDAQIVAMRKILSNYGHTIENDVSIGRTKATKVSDIKLSQEEREQLLSSDLHQIGLYSSVIDTLKNNGNIETVQDLLNCSKAEVRKFVNLNIYAYNAINSQLAKYGLKLMSADEKKKQRKDNQETHVTSSTVTYKQRQEEHFKKAIKYIEQRTQNVKPRNKTVFEENFSE